MDDFVKEIMALPEKHRSFQDVTERFRNWPVHDCFLGVPAYDLYGMEVLEAMPKDVSGFHFYLGSDIEDLARSFVKSPYAETVERLYVGQSCYKNGSGNDYSRVVEILSEGHYPRLKVLELGVWQLFSNSHCAYGTVGDVTRLLACMPSLESLGLYGMFLLSAPPAFPKLKKLSVVMDDPVTGMNEGNISPETLTHLLTASFPVLEEAYIDLENDPDEVEPYALPPVFVSGDNVRMLRRLEVAGLFEAGEKERLLAGDIGQREGMVLWVDEMGVEA